MADFSERMLAIEEYDCDCYAKKVKEHFKTDELYEILERINTMNMPEELITS